MITVGLIWLKYQRWIFLWKDLTAFSKKLHLRCLRRFWICLWHRSLKYCSFRTYSLYQFILPSAHSYFYFHILFMYHALHFPKFIFQCTFQMIPCLFNWSQSKASVVNQMSLFLSSKIFFLLFSTFWKWPHSQRCSDVDQRCETRGWK